MPFCLGSANRLGEQHIPSSTVATAAKPYLYTPEAVRTATIDWTQ